MSRLIHTDKLLIYEKEYQKLCSQFSKAYLSGSEWYFGETLINNYNFKYPFGLIELAKSNKYDLYKSALLVDILEKIIQNN